MMETCPGCDSLVEEITEHGECAGCMSHKGEVKWKIIVNAKTAHAVLVIVKLTV